MKFVSLLKRIGRFLLSLLINLVFHWEGLIPAAILLVLHFWPGIPLYWFFIALGAWILLVLVRMLWIRFAVRSAAETPERENKNPYSFRANGKNNPVRIPTSQTGKKDAGEGSHEEMLSDQQHPANYRK